VERPLDMEVSCEIRSRGLTVATLSGRGCGRRAEPKHKQCHLSVVVAYAPTDPSEDSVKDDFYC